MILTGISFFSSVLFCISGVPSDELELFLLQELTAKGLKKFGSSVELSYSTIQKLVLKQLNIVGQSLTYYLSELRGLARIPDRYKVIFTNVCVLFFFINWQLLFDF